VPIQLWASGTIEAAADLGETQSDERYQQATDDDDNAIVADQGLNLCRQSEDSCTNRQVDGKGSQRPPTDAANQLVFGAGRGD
jgi:hypothetical protein